MKKRHKFNLGNMQLLTMDMGYLVPIVFYDVMPGDKFFGGTRAFIRVMPMIKPIMHPIDVKIHHWFVPYRLIWENWEDFFLKNEEPPYPEIEFDKCEVVAFKIILVALSFIQPKQNLMILIQSLKNTLVILYPIKI